MSLRERYYSRNNVSIWQWPILAVACFVATFLLIFGSSLARYAVGWTGDLVTDVAQWNIKVNKKIAEDGTEQSVGVQFVPTKNALADSNKIMPGQEGYFDVTIDPTGTEVSFTYDITVHTAQLPKGMTVNGYSINDSNRIDTTGGGYTLTVSKQTVRLPAGGAFTSAHKLTVRFYWAFGYADGYDQFGDYKIVVDVTVRQYLGEPSAAAEEAQV